ncbi:MAG: hypothetical protein J6B85_14125 [Lachnospiraceae bacterium]|nr:hypothetical protein [Lachnospiraceae bacterium]
MGMEANGKEDGNAPIINNFIFGENNQQIKDLVEQILDGERPEDPVLITGGQSTGKSYLLNGLCRAYNAKCQRGAAVKISGLDFLDAMMESIRRKDESGMQEYFGEYELILIDDIDDFADKRIVLECFFSMVGRLSMGSTVIMTATRALDTEKIGSWMHREIRELYLHPLSKELFLEMMDSKFVSAGVKLSRKQREFLYVRSNKSVRSFDGVYNKILLNCKVHGNYQLSMNDLILYTRP